MDVKQAKYFLEVSRSGSFTAAAKKLYISAPGLVKAIDRLEDELGVTLFARTRTGVSLTLAGQALARYARAFIRQHEFIVSEVRKAEALQETRVEVCMTWGLLNFFPSDFLSRFVLQNPDLSLTTHNYTLEECHEAMLDCRGAIGMYFGRIDDSALEILFHRAAPLYAVMNRAHPLAGKDALRLADFGETKVLVMNNDSGVTGELCQQLEDAGSPPQIILDGSGWAQAIELIENAGYISFCLPPGELKYKQLVTKPVTDLSLMVNFNMASLKGMALSGAERRFADYVIRLMTTGRDKMGS